MPLKPRIIKESQVGEKLDVEIRKNLCICFPRDKDVYSKVRAWHNIWPIFIAIIEQGNNVIAHAAVVDRIIKVGNENLRVAGLQNVFVLPEHRGRRLSTTVIQAAMAEAQQQDFDCGLLFTYEPVKKVYARNGWLQITDRKFIRIDNGREIEMPQETVKMYYPLRRKDFPAGIVNLQGNDW